MLILIHRNKAIGLYFFFSIIRCTVTDAYKQNALIYKSVYIDFPFNSSYDDTTYKSDNRDNSLTFW